MTQTILIVDDLMISRKLIARSLAALGDVGVLEAADGRDALAVFQEEQISLVLTDWHMPRKDGLELVKEIRAMGSNVPIIMVTVERLQSRVVQAIDAGVDDYLLKPFNEETLHRKVRRLLEAPPLRKPKAGRSSRQSSEAIRRNIVSQSGSMQQLSAALETCQTIQDEFVPVRPTRSRSTEAGGRAERPRRERRPSLAWKPAELTLTPEAKEELEDTLGFCRVNVDSTSESLQMGDSASEPEMTLDCEDIAEELDAPLDGCGETEGDNESGERFDHTERIETEYPPAMQDWLEDIAGALRTFVAEYLREQLTRILPLPKLPPSIARISGTFPRLPRMRSRPHVGRRSRRVPPSSRDTP